MPWTGGRVEMVTADVCRCYGEPRQRAKANRLGKGCGDSGNLCIRYHRSGHPRALEQILLLWRQLTITLVHKACQAKYVGDTTRRH